jgi:AcrR family transcriptional regulator
VLLERGLSSTTVADVAHAAGVAKGTVYLYFDSKEALLAGLRARHLARFVAAVDASVSTGRSGPATRLDRFVDGLFEFSARHRELHQVLFHEAGYREVDAFAEVRGVLERLIADGSATGVFHVRDARAAASFVLHGVHGVLLDVLDAGSGQEPGSEPVTRAPAAVRDLARRSLGVRPGTARS